MMERERRCVQICLLVYTLVFVISGIVLLSVGVNLHTKEGPFATLLPSFPILNAANLIIFIGVVVFCVSFVGCFGAWKQRRCALITFFMCLFVIFLLELVAGCLGFVYRGQVEQFVTEELTTQGLEQYGQAGEAGLTTAWDKMQTMLMCCGVNGSRDWELHTSYYGPGQTPDSCCFSYSPGCGDTPNVEKWYMGCRDSLVMEMQGNIDIICIVAFGVAVMEILGMCLSYGLFKNVDDDEEGDAIII